MTTQKMKDSGRLANKRVKKSANKTAAKKVALQLSLRELLDSNATTEGYDPLLALAILANDRAVATPTKIDIHKFISPYLHSAKAPEDSKGNGTGTVNITLPAVLAKRDLS